MMNQVADLLNNLWLCVDGGVWQY